MPVFELKGTVAYEWMKEKEKNTLRVIPHYEHTTRDGAFAVAVEKGAPSNARLIMMLDGSFEIPLPEGKEEILIQAALSQKSVLFKLELERRRKRQRQSQIPRRFPVPRAVRAGLWI